MISLFLIVLSGCATTQTSENSAQLRPGTKQCKETKENIPKIAPSLSEPKRLAYNESKSFILYAERRHNFSGIFIEEGETYRFKISKPHNWCDASVPAKTNGWPDQKIFFLKVMSWTRVFSRYPSGRLYTVVGGIQNSSRKSRFDMGSMKDGETYLADQSGELYAFANDIYFKYDNNFGHVKISVEKIRPKS